MPSFVVALYSVVFKLWLRHKLLSSSQPISSDAYGSLSRPSGHGVPANASFVDGVASKDLHIDPLTSLSLRIFLPQSALPQDQISHPGKTGLFGFILRQEEPEQGVDGRPKAGDSTHNLERTGAEGTVSRGLRSGATDRYLRLDDKAILDEDWGNEDLFVGENSAKGQAAMDDRRESGQYRGYLPGVSASAHQKLPIVVQFHAGAFVTGSNDSFANDAFCRKIAKLCDAIVVAVGYRLAPEHKYPAAFDDGFEALSWLSKQANLAECSKSLGHIPSGYDRSGSDNHRIDLHRELVDSFGASVVEPWLAAHGDFSRCVHCEPFQSKSQLMHLELGVQKRCEEPESWLGAYFFQERSIKAQSFGRQRLTAGLLNWEPKGWRRRDLPAFTLNRHEECRCRGQS